MRTASPEFRGKFDELRTELIKTGVVEDIAESDYAVTDTKGNNDGFTWKGQKFEESFNTTYVTAGYGRTVGWDFIEGRDFSEDIASDRSGIIINESARKILGIPDPVGETLNYAPGWTKERGNFQILGVVRDMIKGSPFEPANPAITFLANPDMQWLYIMINPSVSAHEATPKIKSVFDRLVPSVPFDFHFADEDYDAKFRGEERIGSLASIFSILAILISCSGLFGLAAYVTEMRSREMSIRKVMGAPVSNLLRLISTEFFALVLISSLIAVPLSILLMEKWLGQFQYRITIGWPVFAIAVTGAICLTLITVSFQILKVALTDPVKNLRSE